MKNNHFFFLSLLVFVLVACQSNTPQKDAKTNEVVTEQPVAVESASLTAKKLSSLPSIDGIGDDVCWQSLPWHPIDQNWLGKPFSKTDFSGQYKIGWGEDFLYLLVDINDDQFVDTHPDGLDRYWDDDCVEVFIDENRSKGNHQYNHNAFAYHIAMDYKVADIGPDSLPHYYNDHVQVKRTQNGNAHIWEMAIAVYDDRYVDGQQNVPQKLSANKQMGFAIAYCDNDSSKERENFIGSVAVEGEDKNRGWIDAGIFASLQLVE